MRREGEEEGDALYRYCHAWEHGQFQRIGLPHPLITRDVKPILSLDTLLVLSTLVDVDDDEPERWSDDMLVAVPAMFANCSMPTLKQITDAYAWNGANPNYYEAAIAHWTALFANVESACARQRRRNRRLPLLLCRQRYYAEAETDDEGAGEARAPADVVVALARPGLEGAFRHMVTFL